MTQGSKEVAGTVLVCLMPEEIKTWLQEIVDAFHQQDVERLAADWTEDFVIRFTDLPEINGKQAAKAWLKSRFARQKGYYLDKSFQAVTGGVICDSWTGKWLDGATGRKMRGLEAWSFSPCALGASSCGKRYSILGKKGANRLRL